VQVGEGSAFVPLQVAMNPNSALPPGPSEPFQAAFGTVTSAPTWDSSPPQDWVTCWPPVNVNPTVQPVIGDVPALVTVTARVCRLGDHERGERGDQHGQSGQENSGG
jgi:hypothetical protein